MQVTLTLPKEKAILDITNGIECGHVTKTRPTITQDSHKSGMLETRMYHTSTRRQAKLNISQDGCQTKQSRETKTKTEIIIYRWYPLNDTKHIYFS